MSGSDSYNDLLKIVEMGEPIPGDAALRPPDASGPSPQKKRMVAVPSDSEKGDLIADDAPQGPSGSRELDFRDVKIAALEEKIAKLQKKAEVDAAALSKSAFLADKLKEMEHYQQENYRSQLNIQKLEIREQDLRRKMEQRDEEVKKAGAEHLKNRNELSALLLLKEQTHFTLDERKAILKDHVAAFAHVPPCTDRWLAEMLLKIPTLNAHRENLRKWISEEGLPPTQPM